METMARRADIIVLTILHVTWPSIIMKVFQLVFRLWSGYEIRIKNHQGTIPYKTANRHGMFK